MKIHLDSLDILRSSLASRGEGRAPSTLDEALRLVRSGRLYEVVEDDGVGVGLVEADSEPEAVGKMGAILDADTERFSPYAPIGMYAKKIEIREDDR